MIRLRLQNQDEGVAWSLIEQGVTDLAYINKTDQYSMIDKTNDRNNLTKENFWKTDLTQVLTDNVIDKMEKENSTADNLRYELVENSDNEFVATKFSDNFCQHLLMVSNQDIIAIKRIYGAFQLG